MQAQAIAMIGILSWAGESVDMGFPAERVTTARRVYNSYLLDSALINQARENSLKLKILTTGGTFDKVYFDARSEFHFGEPIVGDLLQEANVDFEFEVESLLQKDSLEITDGDRDRIRDAVTCAAESRILIIHGTDTLVETARALRGIEEKTVVLFGAMQPARMRFSDAMYNLGFACAAVQLLPNGVHLAMNGRIFDPEHAVKNSALGRFETTG